MKKSIIIAKANALVSQLLCEAFAIRGYETLNAHNETSNLLYLVQTQQPDFLFLHAELAFDTDGVALCRQVRATPNLATKCVIFFSNHANSTKFILPAVFADISGYLYENPAIEEIELCLLRLNAGERYINPNMLKLVNGPSIPNYQKLVEELSCREKEIFRHTAYGHSNGKIAELLFTSIKTVETHKYNITKKLGFHRANELREAAMKALFGELE